MARVANNRKNRKQNGEFIVELPICLFAVLIVFFYPLIDLANTGLRGYFIYHACRTAAASGARGQTFSGDHNSVRTRAIQTVHDVIKAIPGIHIADTDVETSIVVRSLGKNGATSQLETVSPTKLDRVDVSKHQYFVQVTVKGEADPFIAFPLLAGVPGLSAPIPLHFSSTSFVENPYGLTF